MKILLSISDIKLAHEIKERFQKDGITVLFIENGDEVIPRMKAFKPDILAIDYKLPHKSGYDVLNDKCLDKDITKIPTIMVSNSGDALHFNKIPNTPTIKDYYISSHIDIDILLNKIRHIV